MIKRLLSIFIFVAILNQPQIAIAGDLFHVSSYGSAANLNVTLCLNAKAPITCQNYQVSGTLLAITTIAPSHEYPFAGIKVNTPGYMPQNCTFIKNGYCLFSISDTTAASIPLEKASLTYTIGGTLSGLNGTVVLQNNGSNATSVSSNGNFRFSETLAPGGSYNVTVKTQPTEQNCSVTNGSGTNVNANVTNVNVQCVTNYASLSVPATGAIPVNSGSGSLIVTNTSSSYTAYNVHANLPAGWSHVTQDASDCVAIAPLGTCTLHFSTTAPYVAQGNIIITGDNITSPPTTSLAFTINGYLVFSIDSLSSASIIDTAAISSSEQWGNLVQTNAQSLTDGISNTATINGTAGIGTSGAISCYNSTNGGASVGTWYLPAICQMGGSGLGAGCSSGNSTLDNLFQLGFGSISSGVYYWSSTEYNGSPVNFAWLQLFEPAGNSVQTIVNKTFGFHVLCVRSISY